ncbi:MAG: hypothetical protein JXX28_12185 [Deltaproteobacteria bacterium]|nr:hypothetical protein [Deltaproteobacteria bacterium]
MTQQPHRPTLHVFFSLGNRGEEVTYRFDRDDQLSALRGWFTGGAAHEHTAHSALPAALAMLGPLKEGRALSLHLVPTAAVLGDAQERGDKGQPSPSAGLREELPAWARAALPSREALAKLELEDHRSSQAMWAVVERVLEEDYGEGDALWVESTGGIRSIFYGLELASHLLEAVHPEARVIATTYAEVDTSQSPGMGTLHDLEDFRRLGQAAPGMLSLRTRLDPRPLLVFFEAQRGPHATTDHLEQLSDALEMSWPRDLARALRAEPPAGSDTLHQRLNQILTGLREIAPPDPDQLDETTLRWELDLIERLVQSHQHGDAVRVLRETLVSAMVLALHRSKDPAREAHPNPYNPKVRGEAERAWFRLGGAWTAFWTMVTGARNAVAHVGTSGTDMKPAQVREVFKAPQLKALQESITDATPATPWWAPLVKITDDAAPLWLRDNSWPPLSPPDGVAEAPRDLSKGKLPPGKNWADDQAKRAIKNGLPERVYLTVHPVRAAALAPALWERGVPVFHWDGQEPVPFLSPYGDDVTTR